MKSTAPQEVERFDDFLSTQSMMDASTALSFILLKYVARTAFPGQSLNFATLGLERSLKVVSIVKETYAQIASVLAQPPSNAPNN